MSTIREYKQILYYLKIKTNSKLLQGHFANTSRLPEPTSIQLQDFSRLFQDKAASRVYIHILVI